MKALAVLMTWVTLSFACASTIASVQLTPETNTVLHLGQTAVLSVSSEVHYSVGAAGTALALIKQEPHEGTTNYFYRAAEVGQQTVVATPKDPGPDGCISCVTVHYFVQVIQ